MMTNETKKSGAIFSMNEWKPETVYNKLQRIEYKLQEITDLKFPLIDEKRKIESELAAINNVLKSKMFLTSEFDKLNSERGRLVKKKSEIELKISDLKKQSTKLHTEKESAKIDLKSKPNDSIKTTLIELRDKYMSFSADSTRVSSMRTMSSKFAEEIQIIISDLI